MLDVAYRVFAERGYHGASMDEIALGVGVTKPMLYSYFGSKEGLYLSCVGRAGAELLAGLRDAGRREDPPRERLSAGIDAFFAFVERWRDGWAMLYHEAAAQGGPFAATVAESRTRIAAIVAALLCEAEPERDDAALLSHAVVGCGESLANWWLEHPEVPRAEVVRRMTAFVWGGLS